MSEPNSQPDFRKYHLSIAQELHALKNRVRNLVRNHWPTDGEFKEAILRNILRRHVPETLMIGKGFVVSPENVSTQIDLLLVDKNAPTLFKDGDLMIVTPDAVRAIIEVKTSLKRGDLPKVLTKLAEQGRVCSSVTMKEIWTGLFVYQDMQNGDQRILQAVGQARSQTGQSVNCICTGSSTFVRFWQQGEAPEVPGRRSASQAPLWRSYKLKGLAPVYFIANLLAASSPPDRSPTAIPDAQCRSLVWFPVQGGKEQHVRFELIQGETEPHPLGRRPLRR